MSKEDFTCDLNCPFDEIAWCCKGCSTKSKEALNKFGHLYDKEKGFLSDTGCRLSRKEMPKRCKLYNCKEYAFIIQRVWLPNPTNKWHDTVIKMNHGYRV